MIGNKKHPSGAAMIKSLTPWKLIHSHMLISMKRSNVQCSFDPPLTVREIQSGGVGVFLFMASTLKFFSAEAAFFVIKKTPCMEAYLWRHNKSIPDSTFPGGERWGEHIQRVLHLYSFRMLRWVKLGEAGGRRGEDQTLTAPASSSAIFAAAWTSDATSTSEPPRY